MVNLGMDGLRLPNAGQGEPSESRSAHDIDERVRWSKNEARSPAIGDGLSGDGVTSDDSAIVEAIIGGFIGAIFGGVLGGIIGGDLGGDIAGDVDLGGW